MPTARNPFYRGPSPVGGYNNPQVADIANNVGAILLAGESPNQRALREAQAAHLQAQETAGYASANASRAQANKYDAQTTGITQRNNYQTEDAMRRASLASQGIDPDTPAFQLSADELTNRNKNVGQLLTTQALTGNTNYAQFQKGVSTANDRSVDNDVLAGRRSAPDVGRSRAASAGKPLYSFGKEYSGDNFGGAQTVNGIGTSEITLNKDRGTQARAAAGASSAEASLRQAQTVNERADAPVALAGSDGQPLLRDINGNPVRVAPSKAGVGRLLVGGKTTPVPFGQGDDIDGEINAQLGVAKDGTGTLPLAPEALTAVRTRAAQIFQQTKDGPGAVRQALSEMGAPQDVPGAKGRIWDDKPKARTFGSLVAPQGQAPAQAGPVKIKGDADFAALPSGAEFIAPDGTHRRKQ